MVLDELFEMQKVLRDRIDYKKPDRFDKLKLALLVEIAELANEWRGFKFWSQNQEPRTMKFSLIDGEKPVTNPLLEEYVDGLHFILDIAIEIHIETFETFERICLNNRVTDKFNVIFKMVADLDYMMLLLNNGNYDRLILEYIELGHQLGFTDDQIKQAYIDKNTINHTRQDEGY